MKKQYQECSYYSYIQHCFEVETHLLAVTYQTTIRSFFFKEVALGSFLQFLLI